MKELFPGWRMSPTGERRKFQRAEDVPEGWFREGDDDDPRKGGSGQSPAAEAPVAPPVEPVPPAPGSAVPDSILTQTVELVPDEEPPKPKRKGGWPKGRARAKKAKT